MDDIILRNKPGMRKNTATPPLVATDENRRGGGRASEVVPEPVVGLLFAENFDDQPDYSIEYAGQGGQTKDTANIPTGWDGVFNGTKWSPEKGFPENHGSFEINSLQPFGGDGKSLINYRESATQRLIEPDMGETILEGDVTHIRLWMSTSSEFNTSKSATATVNGTNYVFTATTGLEGGPFDTQEVNVGQNDLGPVDTEFLSLTNQRVGRGVLSNAIAVPNEAAVSVVGADVQLFTTDWAARLNQFVSDSQLIKTPIVLENPEGTEELYTEFMIKFSENWYGRGFYEGGWMSKIFRCASWTPGGNMFSGGQRDLGPMYYWDYKADNFGVRNVSAFRGGPPSNRTSVDNYKVSSVQDFGGSGNYNQLGIAGQEVGGTDPQLPDRVNGGLLVDTTELVSHEMLFGGPEVWTKLGFYVKMNSSPGVADGVFSQFVDGHRIRHLTNVPWVESNSENIMVKWNLVSIGGNDHFHPFPNADKFEDWYAIDNIVIRDSLPETLV